MRRSGQVLVKSRHCLEQVWFDPDGVLGRSQLGQGQISVRSWAALSGSIDLRMRCSKLETVNCFSKIKEETFVKKKIFFVDNYFYVVVNTVKCGNHFLKIILRQSKWSPE